MAKVGLEFGEKVEIAGKVYRVLNDGLDVNSVLGELKFTRTEGDDIVFAEEIVNGERQDVNTGEIRGANVTVNSVTQEEIIHVLLTEMTTSDVESLDIKYREVVELENPQLVIVNDGYYVFASSIKKKSGVQQVNKQQKQEQHKDQHHG